MGRSGSNSEYLCSISGQSLEEDQKQDLDRVNSTLVALQRSAAPGAEDPAKFTFAEVFWPLIKLLSLPGPVVTLKC